MKSRIKKGDKVIIVAGKDKGKTGEVLVVHPSDLSLVVKGVNVVKKHQKATATKEAGVVEKELPINISNVAYLDPKESKPTKIGYRFEDGKKVRFCKLSNTVIS